MIQRGLDTSFTNLWSLLLYIQSLIHYIDPVDHPLPDVIPINLVF